MKTALSIALLVLLIALAGGIPVIVYDLHRETLDVHNLLVQAGGAVEAIENTTRQAQSALGQIQTTVATLNDAAAAQKSNWLAAGGDVKKTGEDTRRVVAHVDRILTHFDVETLPALDLELVANGDDLQQTIGRLGDSAEALGTAAATLNTQLSNPQIAELVDHLDESSLHFAAVTANADAMSGDMKLAVHRMAQPPSKLHTALDVAWTTAKFGSLFIP